MKEEQLKYFAISDIHSYYDPMINSLAERGFDRNNKNHIVIVCGDAFDRGDDSVKVFEFLKQLSYEDRLIYIKGNHEDLLFECVNELLKGQTPELHHFHNKTVKTVCMLCGENEWIAYRPSLDTSKMIKEKTEPILEFIKNTTVDYFTLGNKIFVHSWIPCKIIGTDYSWNPEYSGISDNWYKLENELTTVEEQAILKSEWYSARWVNPYLMWKQKLYPEDKCIVFGHFHTSYGHSRIDMKCKEWPQKNQVGWQDAFKPWIKDNAIGLDACCAFSGFINCLVFDEEGNLLDG